MESSENSSFPIVNGHCTVSNDTVYFTNDDASNRIARLFGRNLLRRSIIFALIFGLPLAILALLLIKQGDFLYAIFPAFFAVMFITTPLFYIGYSNPQQIAIRDIETVSGHLPKNNRRLGFFTINYLENGTHARTSIGLPPCSSYSEQLQAFQFASEVFETSGISVEGRKRDATL